VKEIITKEELYGKIMKEINSDTVTNYNQEMAEKLSRKINYNVNDYVD